MNVADCIIIGSGPSGVSAASALLDQNISVTLIDAGIDVPKPNNFKPNPKTAFTKVGGVPLKTTFGSNAPYQNPTNTEIKTVGADIISSYATGGFSHVWGASILPVAESDICNWPIKIQDLTPHYQTVLSWLPHRLTDDCLSSFLPLYSDQINPIQNSQQAQKFSSHLGTHKQKLNESGIYFGQSRLAVSNCQYCNKCLYGCPYHVIYNSLDTVKTLQNNPNFTYLPGYIVSHFKEQTSKVIVYTKTLSGKHKEFIATRIFIAAGTLNSTQITLNSIKKNEITFKDSQYYLIPFISNESSFSTYSDDSHTLAQLFMEIKNPKINPNLVHLQWYGSNDIVMFELQKLFGPLKKLVTPLLSKLNQRLWVIQGYLHSNHSSTIKMELKGSQIKLTAKKNKSTRSSIKKVLDHLNQHKKQLNGKALSLFTKITPPGRSFHSGSSFPMTKTPQVYSQSDIYGRPKGLKRVHIVDSSVLPSIPATTITLTTMANAHRIASEWPSYAHE